MNFKEQTMKLMKNKYFSFLIYFITFVVILGYLAMRDTTSVICFSLVAFLTSMATRNLTIILFTAILITSFLRVHRVAVEGLEGMKEGIENNAAATTAAATTTATTTPATTTPATTTPATDADKKKQPFEVEGATETFTNKNKGGKGFGNGRIDFASTLNSSYENISKILGEDGIKGLTLETTNLMGQQEKLFKSMQDMTPLMNQAKSLMEGLQSFNGGKDMQSMIEGLTGGKK